jgi:hypothetical protein
MRTQLLANLMLTIQYLILKAYSAVLTSIIACLRCYLFSNNKNRKKKVLLLTSLTLIASFFTYNGTFLSIIPIFNGILCILGASLKNVRKYKIIYGICSAIWIYYNYMVGAYVVIISNIFEILSAIIGYKRHK